MKFRLLLGLLLITCAAVVGAQADLTQTVDLSPTSYTIEIPDAWTYQNTGVGEFLFSGDGLEMLVMTEEALEESGYITGGKDSLSTVLVGLYEQRFEMGIDADFVRPVERIGLNAVVYRMEADHYSYIVEAGVDDRLFVDLFEADRETLTEDQITLALQIMASISDAGRVGGVAALPGLVGGIAPSQPESEGSSEACTVTASADPTRLRVGPGENRTSIAFMGAGSYDVLGQATDNAGNAWYKLDKDQAAPNTAANEIWVAAADVSENGDCANVGGAAAPPVIPGASAPPPAPPVSDGGNSGSDNGSDGNPGGFPVPQNGTYVTNLGLYTAVSCQYPEGLSQGSFPTSELGLSPESFYITSSADGGVITFGANRMTRDASGTYTSQIDFGGITSTLRIRAVSSTRFEGSLQLSLFLDGVPCSMSIPVGLQT